MGELFENFRGYDVPAVRREAKAEGKAEGHDTLLIEQVCKKLEKGQSVDRIADDLVESTDMITEICAAIDQAGTHDAEAIYKFMNQ